MQPEKTGRQRRREHFIAAWMKHAGKSNGDVIEATGAGKDLVSKWKNKGMVPTPDYLASLADLFGVGADALFKPPPVATAPVTAEPPKTAINARKIPLVSMVSASNLRDQPGVTKDDILRWINVADIPAEGDWIALQVDGDSMNKIAPDGSTILVNRADATLIDRRFYVFSLDSGAATFKQYRRGPDRLQPYSTSSEHFSVPAGDNIYVVGRVRRVIIDV